MRHQKIKISLLAALLGALVVTGCLTAQKNSPSAAVTVAPSAGLSPGPVDGRIAYMTARLLEELHYSQQPLDSELSEKFFDGYLEALDPNRENFLQSDIAEFAHYRTNLDLFTTGGRERSDLTPAYEIFQRYLERFEQHAAYAQELLKRDNFKFTGDERIAIDRRHAPYPKDLDEAKQLWRDQLRYQYLQEKLSREISPTNDDEILPLTKSNLLEITSALERHYLWNLRMVTNLDNTDVLQTYLDALAHAYDPHSDYLNTAHAQQFSIEMSLALFGIGAQLGEDDGYCKITSLVLGGPAAKSKLLKEGDEIVAVAQTNQPPVDVVDMDLGKVVQLIRGPKGTQVRLTISPVEDRAARRIVTLTRDEIKLEDQEAKAELIESPDGHGGTNRLGVIDLPEFYAPVDSSGNAGHTPKFASVDVAKLVSKLEDEKVGGIVLDLRNNPGGSLEEAIRLTGLFIKDGPVVLVRSGDGHVIVHSDPNPSVLYSGPLVVLVNRFSASASEIAAAALQDYGRALVVGDISTHGKGTVQDVRSLQSFVWSPTSDPGEVKITIAKFYRVNGASTQLKGVVPDIILPDKLNYADEIGEASLENPLPFDTISGVDYDKLNLVEPYLAALRLQSAARIATNQDFIYIAQDIDELKKLQADKTATLNEREALKEHEANRTRDEAREAEIAARKTPDVKIYEISVGDADKPGLPPSSSLTVTNDASLLGTTHVNYSYDSDLTSYFKTNGATAAGSTPDRMNTNSSGIKTSQPTMSPSPLLLDPMLNETENILEDYISALSSNRTLIAN
jgi:carboxyl-terminal processing protease